MKKKEKKTEDYLLGVKFKPNLVLNQYEVDASFKKIKERIELTTSPEIKHSIKRINLFSTIIFRVASSFALLLTLGFLGYNYYNDHQQIIIANNADLVKFTSLPDGSKVWLRSKSSIAYHPSYNKNRNIELKGEALFEVTKDKSHPFTVETKLGNITVLGTVFSVRANENEQFTKALLKEGSIKFTVNNGDNEVILKPGEEAVHVEGANNIEVKKVDNIDKQLAWQSHKYSFNNEPLSEIIAVIADAFNKKIKIQDRNLEKQRFTLKFNRNESFTKILDILSDVAKFKYRQENGIYIIEKL
ncbi:MAG: DUF4974 domain-containing protein [Paludibacter sp.]|nr:DUF4974 domain-containing protein [Paludibacter sp.]